MNGLQWYAIPAPLASICPGDASNWRKAALLNQMRSDRSMTQQRRRIKLGG
ncbi:MAG: hypothetical protein N4J56_004120 [Chroococcidiopsis sp. SAG 2025]|uniref:hypothetical protein n=1 Tax=Chroococcidiopsis sp. SAG 2025 TaxID=171389 RepID=UPI002936F6D3|nr:hypothetical protein [Chroococcidiopsis sp. SAG 2025]MDV2994466.1 hypothetical protein [Chroococcidiopsis sp. SAG 2025]